MKLLVVGCSGSYAGPDSPASCYVVSAEHEGARIIAEARAEAQRLREEVDDYVDTALANFEQFLTRALASIERGRDKMHALREIGTFGGEENDRPLPF